MIIVATAVGGMSLLEVGTAYWITGGLIFAMGLGMVQTMAPATDAVMAAVPEEQAGVGSALNDTVRQVGGALGVGIFGSILSSIYSSEMTSAVAGLPVQAAEAASNQVGAALQIASTLGGETAVSLASASREAFVSGTSTVYILAAIVSAVGVVFVWRYMPKFDIVPGATQDEVVETSGVTAGDLATATVED